MTSLTPFESILLAVFFGGHVFILWMIVAIPLYLILPYWIFYPMVGMYALTLFSGAEYTGKWEWPLIKNGVLPNVAIKYFDMSLLCDDDIELDASKKFLFGVHPHGIFPYGGIVLYASESPLLKRFPGLSIHPCGATVIFKVPILREYLLWTGHLDATRKSVERALSKDKNIGIVIGGEAEVLQTENGKERCVILGREGFVRMALKHKATLVPLYAFGVNDTFTIDKTSGYWLRYHIQRALKLAIPVYWGWMGTPLPHKKKITVAVGTPIEPPAEVKLDAKGNPDPELVSKYHGMYVKALQEAFDKHKAAAGYKDRELELLQAPKRKKKGSGKPKKA